QTTLAIILGSSALLVACANTSTQKDSAWWNDIRNDRYQTVQKHLDKGDFENGFNHQGQTALTYAYREHAFQVYELLLESDQLDINQENQFGETVLMYAALEGDLDRVKELVEKGAKVNK